MLSSEPQERFWTRGDSQDFRYDSAGFLLDPDDLDDDEKPLVSSYTTLAELRDVGCLVLLGAPGLGKTVELRGEAARRQEGSESLFVDLGSTRSEARIERKIFESSVYREWLDGSHLLRLHLDSLDEAQASIGTIADLLAEGLSAAPLERLCLRIACRDAERSSRLEKFLAARLGEENFMVCRLLPLRLRDVHAIAEGRNVDVDAFVDSAIAQRLQPLAMSPITLQMLLGIVAHQGNLPRTRADAYRQGCLLLCEEIAERRDEGVLAPRLAAGQRFAVAARMAGLMMLSGRTRVRLSPGPSELNEVAYGELAGGHEVDGQSGFETSFEVGVPELRDTVRCALFKGFGERGVAFSHRSYAEFLAATWIVEGGLDDEQVEDLLLEGGDAGRSVWPQLSGVASWLAMLSGQHFEWLLEHDPRAVLDTELSSVHSQHRERVVEAWIESHVDLPGGSFAVDKTMGDLRWPEIAAGLRDLILDSDAPIHRRVAGTHLIRAAHLSDMDESLADLALDARQPHPVRVAALRAMLNGARENAKRRVVPLALTDADDDPDDLIQAVALFVTWPEVLSTEQVLGAYHASSSRYDNSFRAFFADRLPTMTAADFPAALNWALRIEEGDFGASAVLRENLLCVASDSLLDPRVAKPYVELAARALRDGGQVIGDRAECRYPLPFSNAESRRTLLQGLVDCVLNGDLKIAALTGDRELTKREDHDWVSARQRAAATPAASRAWAAIAAAIAPKLNSQLLLHRPSEDEPLAPAARSADAELKEALARFEQGELSEFRNTLEPLRVYDSGAVSEFSYDDVVSQPGWQRQPDDMRLRLLDAAERYFRDQESDPEPWFDDGEIPEVERDAFRAVVLLRECRPEVVSRVDEALWKRWTALAVALPSIGEERAWMRAEAARAAPEEFVRWFTRRLDHDLSRHGDSEVLGLGYLREGWADVAEQIVLERARDASLPISARESLFEALARNGSVEGVRLAEDQIHASKLETDSGRELAVRTAFALAIAAEDSGWSRIWPLMVADRRFAGELILAIAGRGMYHYVTKGLDARQAADLFLLLAEHFPRVPSDGPAGGFIANQVRGWTNTIVSQLVAEGDTSALEQLDRLVAAYPEYGLLRGLRYMTRQKTRLASWEPPAPRDIVRLAQDARRRWVGSDAALQEAVLASLRRAQAELRGQPPAAEQLWSHPPGRPKDESALANWVALFLRRDLVGQGVVVGREVQVGAAPRGGRGESVDLQIDAVSGEGKLHSVIVEVKGCWHRELETALEEQLVNRYLASVHRRGIYLVGWFGPAAWTDQMDGRRARCRGASAAELQQSLEEKAREVSQRCGVGVEALVLDCSLENRRAAATPPP